MHDRHELHRGIRADEPDEPVGLTVVDPDSYLETLHGHAQVVVVGAHLGLDLSGDELREIAHVAEDHVEFFGTPRHQTMLA